MFFKKVCKYVIYLDVHQLPFTESFISLDLGSSLWETCVCLHIFIQINNKKKSSDPGETDKNGPLSFLFLSAVVV